jgi:hypothetical protein
MLNTITTIRLPDGKEVAFVDWSDKPVYGTCEFVHGFTQEEIDLFGYTEGDPVPAAAPTATILRTATQADTIIEAPGSMASTEERMIYAIKPELFALTADPVNQQNQRDMATASAREGTGEPIPNPSMLGVLNQHLLLSLEISQKLYASSGLGYFNAGFGVHGAGGTMGLAAGAGRTYATNGLPSQEAVRSYVVPQYMGGQEKFRVFISNPGGAPVNFGISENNAVATNEDAVIRARVYLEGLYKRPVS